VTGAEIASVVGPMVLLIITIAVLAAVFLYLPVAVLWLACLAVRRRPILLAWLLLAAGVVWFAVAHPWLAVGVAGIVALIGWVLARKVRGLDLPIEGGSA
jgi:hypothetical protein